MSDRFTYKSAMGDYGSIKVFDNEFEEICALRNVLGKYEDLGYTPEELKGFLQNKKIKNNAEKLLTNK